MNRKITALLLVVWAFLGAIPGCVSDPRFRSDTVYLDNFRGRPKEKKRAPHDDVSYWDDSGAAGPASVVINLSEQKSYFYKGDSLVGVSTISSGREAFATPPGSFRIVQKNRDHVSSIYGNYVDREGNIIQKDIDTRLDPKPPGAIYDGARMPYFMRFNGGVGMHEGFLPGYPASHGCVRMPGFMAAKFFDNVQVGTPVNVVE